MFISAAALVSTAAFTQGPLRDQFELRDELPSGQEPNLEDLSSRIYLIADNQRREVLGDGIAWMTNSFADAKFSSTAIRPPQLDQFGQDLLAEALGMIDGFVLHLGDAADISTTGEFARFAFDMRRAPFGWVMAPGNHDGYLLGNSSRTRDRFIRAWDAAAETDELDGTRIVSRALQKDRFVGYYLAALILEDAAWSAPLAESLGSEVARLYARAAERGIGSFADYWIAIEALQQAIYERADSGPDEAYDFFELPDAAVPADRPTLRRVAWHIDKDKVWRSFVIQELDISPSSQVSGTEPISILVVDSSQYGFKPAVDRGMASKLFATLSFGRVDVQVAGLNANLLETQVTALDRLMEAMNLEQRRWIVASHHPFEEFGRESVARFHRIRDSGGFPITLSAHTHTGEFRWNHDGSRDADWLEINVGSILDAPVEYRDLKVHRLDDRFAVSTRRFAMEEQLDARGLILAETFGVRPAPEDPDYYLNYADGLFGTEEEADFLVKRVLLASYLRMLRLFEADDPDQSATDWPTGPDGAALNEHDAVVAAIEEMLSSLRIDDVDRLTSFLYELRAFDRTRKFSSAVGFQLRKYRISQAIWAGQAEPRLEDIEAPEIDPGISFVVLPAEPG
jgi:hypothetical protein